MRFRVARCSAGPCDGRRSGGVADADADVAGQRVRRPRAGKIGLRCTLATLVALNRPRRFHLEARLLLHVQRAVSSATVPPIPGRPAPARSTNAARHR